MWGGRKRKGGQVMVSKCKAGGKGRGKGEVGK